MFTRCPQCKTVHPLNAGLLSNARGLVQCGHCGRTFSALNFLFDQRPAGEEQRLASGSGTALPVLGSDGKTETGIPLSENSEPENNEGNEQQPASEPDVTSPITDSDEEAETDTEIPSSENSEPENNEGNEQQSASEPDATSALAESDDKTNTDADATPSENNEPETLESKLRRLAWPLATALLVLITITHIIWTFREPLLDNRGISAWMKTAGWLQVEQQGLLKDPQQILLVSRDMHTHPTRSGILVLSLTFVNLASRTQVFPELEVTLMDADGQPVAQRRLQPVEYLRPGADFETGLAADVYLPVLLEFGDPGEQAVGFEIQFL